MENHQNDTGCTALTQAVFPGITLIRLNVHAQEAHLENPCRTSTEALEIFHCREGRMELNIGGDFCYVSPGDLLIARAAKISPLVCFPLRHYHGLIVRVDIQQAPHCLSSILRDVNVQPQVIAERFCGSQDSYIARCNPSFEHIFSEMYAIPDAVKEGFAKIKVLELMLFLSVFDTQVTQAGHRGLPPAQVHLAKSVATYQLQHMGERYTLNQVATIFGVSRTCIKNSFKAVYGVSFYSFIKAGKMESAAYMLEHTDKPIVEIAGEHGYENSSKFANAFRSVKGISPGAYRQQNQKTYEAGKTRAHAYAVFG